MCHYTKKNTNKKQYDAVRKEFNNKIPQQADQIPSYYQEQKKYYKFKGGIYGNTNVQNTDDIINVNTNENDNNLVDTIEDVRKKDDIYTMDGDKPHFTESEATIEDLKDMGVPVKHDIKYYAQLSGVARERMEILHNIHKKWP